MKILFVGINASYSHICLAVRAICEYVKNKLNENTYGCNSQVSAKNYPVFETAEFTINQPVGEILRGIYERLPDLVLFSTYIWNAEITAKIIPDIKKLLPAVMIGAGGPEFGFAAELYLKKLPELDFVIKGEGEQTTLEIVEGKDFNSIKGLYYRGSGDNDESVIFTGERELICDFSEYRFLIPSYRNFQLPQAHHPSTKTKSTIMNLRGGVHIRVLTACPRLINGFALSRWNRFLQSCRFFWTGTFLL